MAGAGEAMRVAVLGLGTMGCGIAEAVLRAGLQLSCADSEPETTRAGLERLRRRVDGHVAAGLADETLAAAASALVTATPAQCCAGAQVVIEAVPEDLELKRKVLHAAAVANPGGLLASNTSSLPVDELARGLPEPERFLGIHFFNPAEWVPGVELVRGSATSSDAVDDALRLLRRLGKTVAVVPSSPGFIANRLQLALFLECVRCVDEGLVGPEDLDAIVTSTFGFRLGAYGPFRVADMAGLDVYASILSVLAAAFGERFAIPRRLAELVADGRLGLKAGAGFASYTDELAATLQASRDATYARLLGSIAAGTRNGDEARPETVA